MPVSLEITPTLDMRSRKMRLRDSKRSQSSSSLRMVVKAAGHVLGEILGQVMLDPADAHVGHGQTRAGQDFR